MFSKRNKNEALCHGCYPPKVGSQRHDTVEDNTARPLIVCLCGSTRFSEAFQEANFQETLAGKIVLSIGCDMKSDAEVFRVMSEEQVATIKADLDALHKRKIDMADEVLILNVGGYIGHSTLSELVYALVHGKRIRFLEGHHEKMFSALQLEQAVKMVQEGL